MKEFSFTSYVYIIPILFPTIIIFSSWLITIHVTGDLSLGL
jgi:hypothetical protein